MYLLKFTDIGEGLHEAEILKWFVDVGETVKIDDPIVEVQTDKTAVEITSPKSGVIRKRIGEEGDTVFVGDILVEIETEQNGLHSINHVTKSPEEKSTSNYSNERFPHLRKTPEEKRVIAAPSVRKLARQLRVDLKEVSGSASGGRITKQDVLHFKEQQTVTRRDNVQPTTIVKTPTHDVNTCQTEAIDEIVPIRGLRKKIYENMVKSAFTIPHTTGMDEVSADLLIKFKNELNKFSTEKITFLPIIVKCVVEALKNNPIFNASIDENKNAIILKKTYNIGIATATTNGLVVPVIHHADQKSIAEIAREIIELSQKAEAGKLSLEEIQGSTFTISNTGSQGGFYATPIINYPEVAILGIHAIKEKPVILPNREIGIGQMMGISLSFDHRIIDGEPAGKFMNDVKTYIEHPEKWMLHAK
ncbi:dihydrolipoamide acetyltransferase family protein [Bacillus andreraoultii]|uniref:dihydrolipoamide acetyltransferase family protein n=1 Tax=Bacillus andreraoultii TaxID=1499685 RepID=UPI00053A47E8|nr:dihydrolipoamide acetyltransferase family protein [Bacillus andreraoultii]